MILAEKKNNPKCTEKFREKGSFRESWGLSHFANDLQINAHFIKPEIDFYEKELQFHSKYI